MGSLDLIQILDSLIECLNLGIDCAIDAEIVSPAEDDVEVQVRNRQCVTGDIVLVNKKDFIDVCQLLVYSVSQVGLDISRCSLVEQPADAGMDLRSHVVQSFLDFVASESTIIRSNLTRGLGH